MSSLQLEKQLGCGTYSNVFQVTNFSNHLRGKESFALKVANEFGVDDLRKEHRILRYLYRDEPEIVPSNIIRIYEPISFTPVVISQGVPNWSLALVLCREDLYTRMNREPLTMPQIKQLAKGVLEALRFLNDRSIVHADLKPSNILITFQGHPVIGDFGSSFFRGKAYEIDGFIQTSGYRSPEAILRGECRRREGIELTERIDIWSLALILLEAYLGKIIFPMNTLCIGGEDLFALTKSLVESRSFLHLYSFLSERFPLSDFLVSEVKNIVEKATSSEQQNSLSTEICLVIQGQLDNMQNLVLLYLQEFTLGKSYHEELRNALQNRERTIYELAQQVPQKLPQYCSFVPIQNLFEESTEKRGNTLNEKELEVFTDLLTYMIATRPWMRLLPNQLLTHPFFSGRSLSEWQQTVHYPQKELFICNPQMPSISRVTTLVQGTISMLRATLVDRKEYIIKTAFSKEGCESLMNEDFMLRYLGGRAGIVSRKSLYSVFREEKEGLYLFYQEENMETLYALLQDKFLSLLDIKKVLRQLIDTLFFLERKEIVHSNINPNTVLFSKQNLSIHLSGFSNAFFAREFSAFRRAESIYNAPEEGQFNVNPHKRDIWSVGRVLSGSSLSFKIFEQAVRDNSEKDVFLVLNENWQDSHSSMNLARDFLELMQRMQHKCPKERISLEEIQSTRFVSPLEL